METKRKYGLKQDEILIEGIDCQITCCSYGTEEKIRIRALNSLSPRQVEIVGSLFKVPGIQGKIGEGGKTFLQFFKLPLRFDSGEDLLTDWADKLHPCFPYQLFQLL